MFFWVNLHRVLKNVAVSHSFPLWLLEPYFLNGVFRLHAIITEKLSHQLIWYYFGASFNNTASCACFPGSPRCWYVCWSSHKNKDNKTVAGTAFGAKINIRILVFPQQKKRTFLVLSHWIFSLLYRRERCRLRCDRWEKTPLQKLVRKRLQKRHV